MSYLHKNTGKYEPNLKKKREFMAGLVSRIGRSESVARQQALGDQVALPHDWTTTANGITETGENLVSHLEGQSIRRL